MSAITTQVQASGDATKLEAPPPLLALPDPVGYERLSSDDAQIVADDGRPIAQFRQAPLEFAESVEMYLPEMKPWEDPELEAYAVLSSVRYSGSGHTILVTTARPSPGALRRAVAPGEQAIQLAGGSAAWLSTKMGGAFPNRVLFIQDDLIVTVASDLSPERLQELAEQVEIR